MNRRYYTMFNLVLDYEDNAEVAPDLVETQLRRFQARYGLDYEMYGHWRQGDGVVFEVRHHKSGPVPEEVSLWINDTFGE